jgi:CBS domain containing-hemolysin-like protein
MLWLAVLSAILSGYFSLNGYAVRMVTRRQLEPALAGRPQVAEAFFKHQADLHMACTLLRAVFNMLLLIGILWLFNATPQRWLSLVLAAAVASIIVSIVSIAIPHAWARHAAVKVVAANVGLLLLLRRLLFPLVALMRAFEEPVRRLSGGEPIEQYDPDGSAREPSRLEEAVREEILHAASAAQAEGAVQEEEMEMIQSVIDFGHQRAGEVMTPRTDIDALAVEAGVSEIRKHLLANRHTRIPICEGDLDNIIGVLHVKDLLAVEDLENIDLRKLMRKPFFVPETKRLDELLREFKARKLHRAIVLDEYGGTAGLITLEDLVEEIVGEIADEHDVIPSALIRKLDERTFEVDGRTYIDDINDATGLKLPEDEDYDTLAGFVFSELGFIPPQGETLTAYGARFTVLAADERRITRVRLELLPKAVET